MFLPNDPHPPSAPSPAPAGEGLIRREEEQPASSTSGLNTSSTSDGYSLFRLNAYNLSRQEAGIDTYRKLEEDKPMTGGKN